MRDRDRDGKNKNPVVALTIADLHLDNVTPLIRADEEDWLETQAGYLRQVCELQDKYRPYQHPGGIYVPHLPVLIPGDIFNRAVVSPECVNMALRELPERVYAIAGNHDLPNHNYEEIYRSSYGTLVEAKRITNLQPIWPGSEVTIPGYTPIRLHAFPYGSDIHPLENPLDMYIDIALIHAYIWKKDHGYPGAPEEKKVVAYVEKLMGYDIALFGDNHSSFLVDTSLKDADWRGPLIFNIGCFMRRRKDELKYKPCVGLIHSDGQVSQHYLDTSQDKYVQDEVLLETLNSIGVETFIEELSNLGHQALDFTDAVNRLLERKKVPNRVKKIILRALQKTD